MALTQEHDSFDLSRAHDVLVNNAVFLHGSQNRPNVQDPDVHHPAKHGFWWGVSQRAGEFKGHHVTYNDVGERHILDQSHVAFA